MTMEQNKRMIAYRNEIIDECLTIQECFAKHLISDQAVIMYLVRRDIVRLLENNANLRKKRTFLDITFFLAEKYCISTETVKSYYYKSDLYHKHKAKGLHFEQLKDLNNLK